MYSHKRFLQFVEGSKQNGYDLVSVSVLETSGSTYAKAGNRMLINSKGESIGSMGGQTLQKQLLEASKIQLVKKTPKHYEVDLRGPDSTHGVSTFLIEPFFYTENYDGLKLAPSYNILLFGNDPRCQPIITIADTMGWHVTVVHEEEANSESIKAADQIIDLNSQNTLEAIDLRSYHAAIIVSHKFESDCAYLDALRKSDIAYIGLMGNKKEVKKKIDSVDPNLINNPRLFAPIGLNISTHTPESIALSICAQIEARKNGKL